LDRKIEASKSTEKVYWTELKERLVGKKGVFREINATDAQGYSSPSSYRKKAFLFGKWSQESERIYQRLKNGEWTFSDLEVAF